MKRLLLLVTGVVLLPAFNLATPLVDPAGAIGGATNPTYCNATRIEANQTCRSDVKEGCSDIPRNGIWYGTPGSPTINRVYARWSYNKCRSMDCQGADAYIDNSVSCVLAATPTREEIPDGFHPVDPVDSLGPPYYGREPVLGVHERKRTTEIPDFFRPGEVNDPKKNELDKKRF